MALDDLRRSPMMSHLLDALEGKVTAPVGGPDMHQPGEHGADESGVSE